MAERKSYLLRLPPDLLDDLNRWAADELRSVNAQIEFVLREAMRKRKKERNPEPVREEVEGNDAE